MFHQRFLYGLLLLVLATTSAVARTTLGYYYKDFTTPYDISFSQLQSQVDYIYIAFLEPLHLYNVNANEYRTVIADARRNQKEVLLSIGGWSARGQFSQISDYNAWAQDVSNVVNDFGASGVDIDFEQGDDESYNTILLERMIPALNRYLPGRAIHVTVMPGKVTANAGVFRSILNSVQKLNLMTYDMGRNDDPVVTANQAAYVLGGHKGKINVGVTIGPQMGNCVNDASGWCRHDNRLGMIADELHDSGFAGAIVWTDRGTLERYHLLQELRRDLN